MRESFRKNLLRRVATAAVVLPLLVLLILKGDKTLVSCVILAVVVLGFWEFLSLVRGLSFKPLPIPGFVLAIAFFLDVAGVSRILLSPWALLLLFGATLRLRPAQLPGAALTVFGAAYLGLLGGTIASLPSLAPGYEGRALIILLLAIIMTADTLAFFSGKAAGRTPLAKTLSPGKTWEGAAGGLLGGALGALVVRYLALKTLPLLDTVVLGILVALLGLLGDLFESLLKRSAGAKDSGTLFPGHGGMLDRLDSLLFGAPLLYYYFGYLGRLH